jgi:hypothetical protein
VIGVLSSFDFPGLLSEYGMPAFFQGLKDAGFVEGRNTTPKSARRRMVTTIAFPRLADPGATVFAGSPSDFGKHIAAETEKWGKVVGRPTSGPTDGAALIDVRLQRAPRDRSP